VALLATRSWGAQEPVPQDARGPGAPDPASVGALDPASVGALDPNPPNSGAPEPEGSRQPGGVRGAVHSPPAGPLAVLVHGVTSSSRTWWRVGPALAERGYRVLAVDLRGHGASPRPGSGLSIADLAADVAETVAAELGADIAETVAVESGADPPGSTRPAVELLVGHSLGALVALELVGAHPGLARRLVLEDPPGSRSLDWPALAADIEADTRLATTDPAALRRDLAAANPAWPPGEAERRVADLADCDGQAIAAALRAGVPFDLPAQLAAADLPILMLLAEEALGSLLVGLDRKAAIEALPNGRTRVLPAGHSVHREALDAWLSALDTWVAAPG
jgi:pimeloyl-ACP methyl ester carboxylesterase